MTTGLTRSIPAWAGWLALAAIGVALTYPTHSAALSCLEGVSAKESRENSDVEVDAVVVEIAPDVRDLEVVNLINRPGPDLAAIRVEPQGFAYNTFLRGKIRVGDAFRLYLTRRPKGLTLMLCQNHMRLAGADANRARRAVERVFSLPTDAPASGGDDGSSQKWLWIAVAVLVAVAAPLAIRRLRSVS